MLASIHSGSAKKVWPEILNESDKHQSLLFVFPGGRLASHDEYEYMRNGIFGLIGHANFDGVISWASSLSGFSPEKKVEEFHLARIDIPLVTFGLKIGSTPVVNIDTYTGMKQLVFHLAKRHKCRKIAFIGGPRAHSSAEERYRAYRDALKDMGIPADSRLERLDTPWTEGRRAVLGLLDEQKLIPGVDFDAVCTASDLLTFEAAKLLQERGYRIPADVALGGFNDSDESNLFSPTYTTVRMPFERQAIQAYRMLMERLDGRNPEDRLLKTKLVIRQSCGCLTESVHLAGMTHSPQWKRLSRGSAILAEAEVLRLVAGTAGFSEEDTERFLKPVVSSFISCLAGRSKGLFINTLDTMLSEFIFQDRGIDQFQDMLSFLRIACRGYAESLHASDLLETLLGQGRVLVSDGEKRISNYRAWKERTTDHWLSILNHEFLCAKDFDSIVRIAARYLPELNILSGYFVLDGSVAGQRILAGGFDASGYAEGKTRILELKGNQRVFPSDRLLPESVFPSGRGAYLVLPLYYESTSLGYAILQLKHNDASIYEEIRAQLSSAMRGVLLFEQVNDARKRVERAEKIKTEFLAGISGELQEPIDLIHAAATTLLEDSTLCHRDEIERIASLSARQRDLTRHLLDLSNTQVDDFALQTALFNPLEFAREFMDSTGAPPRKKKWGTLRFTQSPPGIPLACGDKVRLGQVLEIFLECLFHDLDFGAADLTLSLSATGIRFSIRGETPSGTPARKLRELRTLVEAAPGFTSLDKMRIGIELAKRIAFLHGGSIGCCPEDGEFGLTLLLPYPSIDPSVPHDSQEQAPAGIGVIGGTLPDSLAGEFPGFDIRKIGIAEAGASEHSAPSLAFIYINPTAFDEEDAVALRLLLENSSMRKNRCFIDASRMENEDFTARHAAQASIDELLRSFLPEEVPVSILTLAASEREDAFQKTLADFADARGFRILRCRTLEALELLKGRESPRLLVLFGQDREFAASIGASTEFSSIPLICIAEKFNDPGFEALLSVRPRVLFFNAGRVFEEGILAAVGKLLAGEDFLPSPTGAIVIKAIFFLNKYFRTQISRWKLSEHVNASEDYLSRIFHRQMSIPLWDYLNRLRIDHAVSLLESGTETIAEIAARAGFQDQAYFCRVFRRIAGTTPGSLRKLAGHDVRKVQ